MKSQEILQIANSILKNRTFLYDTGYAHTNKVKLESLSFIKRHIDYAKDKEKMIYQMLPKFYDILPGQKSKYYESTINKLKHLEKLCYEKFNNNTRTF